MAEACRLANPQYNKNINDSQTKIESFSVFNVMCVFISLITILADLTTDILVFVEYCKDGFIYWAIGTFMCMITPNIVINLFSIRWFLTDKKIKLKRWFSHLLLFGLLERYVNFLQKVFACQNFDGIKTQKLISQRNDLSLLHFLYIFTGTIPQIILQSYAIITLDQNYYTKVFALSASNASVLWGCATYLFSIITFSNESLQWASYIFRLIWHFGMLIARIFGILLFTVIFGVWTLLPLGLHWIAMTLWILLQKTNFCSNKLEEFFYNAVMAFVYCFCYINLREGHTRYRLMMYYTLMVTQNFGSLFLYVLISEPEKQRKAWSITATTCIILGTVLGITGMILYYRFFHAKGPIPWKPVDDDVELNNKVKSDSKNNISLKHVRSFKSQKEDIQRNIKSNLEPNKAENKTDKKILLDHLIARSGSPTFTSAPVETLSRDASSIEIMTVDNTPQPLKLPPKPTKKKTVCSPTELTLKLSALQNLESSIDKIASINSQKRRGICSSDELREDFANITLDGCNTSGTFCKTLKNDHSSEISQETDGTNKKTSSDSIDMDLDLSFSDINSSDINTFNENIVQKLCLSALKNIKVGNQDADIENIQRIAIDILKEMYSKKDRHKKGLSSSSSLAKRELDTPTEILSVHDYENICAVNIAREAWGLRSWNGYCDIENWLHDGSVVRDRRRDTLTSASTEISSCISQELKSAILSAPPFPKKAPTYSNVFIRFDKTNQDDYNINPTSQSNDETFLAKPCVVDSSKDPNQLEPIMEELDDLGDVNPTIKKRLNSESSLVATIDEIRKANVTNSPRNLFHRNQVWDSPQFDVSTKIENNLKRALWKEPSKLNPSNIMKSLPEKENVLNYQDTKYETKRKELSCLHSSASLDLDNAENIISLSKNYSRRHSKSNTNSEKSGLKINNHTSDQHSQDISNKDIDYLWQLVSENTGKLPHMSNEDLSAGRINSSLQSLIQKDNSEPVMNSVPSKVSNVKKTSKSRPRRKFSILRERFEPKSNFHSDEEILCSGSNNTLSTDSNVLNVKNHLDVQASKDIKTAEGKEIPDKVKTNNYVGVESSLSKNIKDKRSIFVKQVLSPPKLNTKLRYKV